DRSRALEGLESAGVGFDRDQFEAPLSTLPPRVFLAQSTTGVPHFFKTRWTMSFLRGPITRDQIRDLRLEIGGLGIRDLRLPSESQREAPNLAPASLTPNPQPPTSSSRPSLPPAVREVFMP